MRNYPLVTWVSFWLKCPMKRRPHFSSLQLLTHSAPKEKTPTSHPRWELFFTAHASFVWGKVNFFLSHWCVAVFWKKLCWTWGWWYKNVFIVAEQLLHRAKGFYGLLCCSYSTAGKEVVSAQESWEETQLEQVSPTDQRHIPYQILIT